MVALTDPVSFTRGPALKNRLVLAPLTNLQSFQDGRLSDDEFRWLTMRARGGFGLTMTCAASVSPGGLGFPGQLGAHDDIHLEGLTRLADAIRRERSHSVVQLHHAGMRSPPGIISGAPVCPSANSETGARALSRDEVRSIVDMFVDAARRCDRAGFDGVEIHGAHGYLLCQFLSAEINFRNDEYGGPPENRARLLFEIVDGIRASCRSDFSLGVRLSPERFGLRLSEIRALAQTLMLQGRIDYLDLSLWDVFKEPEEVEFKGRPLVSWFVDLERSGVRLGAAGKLTTGAACSRALRAGLDFVVVGRAAILHHDFADRVCEDPDFSPVALPVAEAHLVAEGLGPAFVNYMKTWKGFVAEAA